tara:strand:+ start:381 stop:596 length:216 start_codon:yes stop_codon:yes gene_type:complete
MNESDGEPTPKRDVSCNPSEDMTSVVTTNDLLRLIQQMHSMLGHLSLKIHQLEQSVSELEEKDEGRWLVEE